MLRRALFIFVLLLLVTAATAAVPPTTKAEAVARLLPKEEAQAGRGSRDSRVGRFKDYALIVAAIMGGTAVFPPTKWVAGATDVVAEWVDGESCMSVPGGRKHRQDSLC